MNDKVRVVIYGDEYCAYCAAARMLFTRKGVPFEDVVVSRDPARFDEMLAKSGGRRSIPQVFIADVHIGGFDDLSSLDKSGELDKLLAGDAAGLNPQ
jgi:glutaredoxin 3